MDQGKVVEVLQPTDFAVRCGPGVKDGIFVDCWIYGTSVIGDFYMTPDNVDITVNSDGMLSMVPREAGSGTMGGLHIGKGWWKKVSELESEGAMLTLTHPR